MQTPAAGNPSTFFLTGGSGFVGSAVVGALLAAGHGVHALVNRKPIERDGVTSFTGGLYDDAALQAGLAGCDAAIHLVGIIRESGQQTFERVHHQGAVRVIDAAKRAGVRRFVHMSALGVRPGAPSAYFSTKAAAEAHLKASGLDWTIFRPSLIHGPGGEFMQMVAGFARGKQAPYFFMPYFGTGLIGHASKRIAPVFIDDVARAFTEALDQPQTIGKSIDLCGPEVFDWPGFYATVSRRLLGKPKLTVGLPAWYAKLVATLVPGKLLPFNKSQVQMAVEDSVCDAAEVEKQLGWLPRPFTETFDAYADRL